MKPDDSSVAAVPDELPFKSFWIADFQDEDRGGLARMSDGSGAAGAAERMADEYRLAAAAGIHCVREAVGWREVERPGGLDFASVQMRADVAARHDIDIVWTLCRGDWPDDVDVLSAAFVERFRAYADAVARAVRQFGNARPPVYAPIEEIAFLGFCVAETGLIDAWQRERRSRSDEAQNRLVEAAIAACDAVRAIDPRARCLYVEALPRTTLAADDDVAAEWRTFDLLSGRARGAGGHPRYLDLIGVNCHASRETAARTLTPLPGVRGARRRAPLAHALSAIADRYGRPIVVGERSPAGVDRDAWLSEIGDGIREAQEADIPIAGVCVRPGGDRLQWRDPRRWGAFGLWDLVLEQPDGAPADRAYARTLAMVRSRIGRGRAPSRRSPS